MQVTLIIVTHLATQLDMIVSLNGAGDKGRGG